uniref:DH domain-containing protein n=1 Tax=Arcella intermedia TaxID=1963864 RepID=A0A6B2L2V1_9EUKA
MRTLINDVYEPLSATMASESVIEHNQFRSLFPEGQIKIIYTAHSDILPRLRERKETWSDHQAIGDIFLEMCKFLRLYTKYAEKYGEVDATLEQLKKDKKFLHFLAQRWPDGNDHYSYLASLLITPIQRIPRYQMLLDSLYKKTWTSHIDYVALGEALTDMKKTAQHVNDKAKEADNAKKLVLIDASISGMKKSLVAANRKFIKEGFLVQKTEKNEWKKRYFFLFSDCLIRARPNRKQKGTYIFIEKVSLKKGTVSSLDKQEELEVEESQRPHSFEFKQPHPLRYVLVASSVEEKHDWMNAIQRALDEISKAEQEHEEVAKKISVQKAHMARNLIAASLLQHTGGSYRDRLNSTGGSPKNSQKSNTVDPSNMRSFAEQLASAKMTTQEKWQQTKQAEPVVQNWEKEKQQEEAKAKLQEALEKRVKQKETDDKKKEIQKQLNSLGRGEVKSYREAISQYKQHHGKFDDQQ